METKKMLVSTLEFEKLELQVRFWKRRADSWKRQAEALADEARHYKEQTEQRKEG